MAAGAVEMLKGIERTAARNTSVSLLLSASANCVLMHNCAFGMLCKQEHFRFLGTR